MKTLIVYASFHHKNTEKIAKTIGSVFKAKVIPFSEVNYQEISKADLIGFGSGVYFSKFHKGLIGLVENLPQMNKKVFLFSTSGVRKNFLLNRSHLHFKKILQEKKFKVIGEFNCLGFDNYGILKLFGGINRKRPNKKDIKKAKKFAQSIYNTYKT